MRLGVIGAGGTVGGTLANYLTARNHEVFCLDPDKGFKDDLSQCEAVFVCVPVPTNTEWKQDLRILKQVLKDHQKMYNVPFYIRSTVLPKTCDHLHKIFRMRIYAMPEFLTERTKQESFLQQGIICGAEPDPIAIDNQELFLDKIFPEKEIMVVSNREAELAKYAHNAFGAMKVNFFNLIRKYSETIKAQYENVIDGVLLSGYINEIHTMVPGPDGKHGFGGTCFPKDTAAFIKELNRLNLQSGSLTCTMAENFIYRTCWDKDNFKQPQIKFDEKINIICNEPSSSS